MRKRSKKKTGLITILLILVLLISVGYAAISTSLSINGNATIKAQKWLVYFTNIQTTAGGVTPTTAPTTSGTSTTELTWAVPLSTPGDFYEFTVDVKNDGSYDAMIGSLSNTTLTTEQAKYLDYKVTYSDGATIEQYDKLESGETETLKVRVEFKSEPEELPSTAQQITFTYTSNYVQADSNAKERNTATPPVSLTIGNTVNYVTSLGGVTLDNWKVFDTEGDYVYLIYGDYLPNAAVKSLDLEGITTTYGGANSVYGFTSLDSRKKLFNALNNTSNWSSLLTGTLDGTKQINETTTENVWAMGAPTIELWANSWNTVYPDDWIYTKTTDTPMSDGLTGYYVGLTENPSTVNVETPTQEERNNKLYFPHDDWEYEGCIGYWITSAAATEDDGLVYIDIQGVGLFSIFGIGDVAPRPVIRLPISDLN